MHATNRFRPSRPDLRLAPARSTAVLLLSLLLTLAVLAGCAAPASPSAPGAPAGDGEKTVLAVSGAFALFPMVTVWAEQYKAVNPNVEFDIQAGGAGKGMTDVLAGAVDIAMVSREIRDEETSQGAYGVPVTIDAVVGTFNAANPYAEQILAQGITPEKAAAIWVNGETATWGQLLGTDAADTINVYTRSDSAGAAEMWVKFAGGKAQVDHVLACGGQGAIVACAIPFYKCFCTVHTMSYGVSECFFYLSEIDIR